MEWREDNDSLGTVKIPNCVPGTDKTCLWGTTTQRVIDVIGNISGIKVDKEFVIALAEVKMAAAKANSECGALDKEMSDAIVQACQEIVDGKHFDQFQLDGVVTMGAGTSWHMNMNEVIASLAHMKLGGKLEDEKKKVHPNDHVNYGQSTNDVIPTTIRLAALKKLKLLLPVLEKLEQSFNQKAIEFSAVIKSGRTHMMDAVGTTLGNEFGAYATIIKRATVNVRNASLLLKDLGIGGTAAGTGVNTAKGYKEKVILHLRDITGLDVRSDPDLFAAMESMYPFTAVSGTLRNLALDVAKIASDLILLNSGPNTGLSEITLPEIVPGSSIMPGKINPSMAEALIMACHQVIGNDTAISYDSRSGQIDLNVLMPNISSNILQSIGILTSVLEKFRVNCLDGIVANRETCESYFTMSGAAATILNRTIGYKKAAEYTLQALRSGKALVEVLAEKEGEELANRFEKLIKEEADRLLRESKDRLEGR